MIDAPGPWGTGPFTLTEGWSSLDTEAAVIADDPYACVYLQREIRTPVVRLTANERYWDRRRGPHLREVVFRNDVVPERALELVCGTEGQVDIVTEVPPADAERVERSEHARLVAIDAVRSVVGIIDRHAEGLPLASRDARLALNLAVDRQRLISEAYAGHARLLAGLTPAASLTKLDKTMHRLSPLPHDPARAAELWRSAAGGGALTIRLAALHKLGPATALVAEDLRRSLSLEVVVEVSTGVEDDRELQRQLAERTRPLPWDVLIFEQTVQESDATALELHHAFVGELGALRAGPVDPEFERRWEELVATTNKLRLAQHSDQLDRYVYDEVLALFLCAPQALYAVNRHVDFVPYRTTFELADTSVDDGHWSRRAGA